MNNPLPHLLPFLPPSLLPSLPPQGWLTIGPNLTSSNFKGELFQSFFEGTDGYLLQHSDDIEMLRPKTPPPKGVRGGRGGAVRGGRGAARGRGRGGF